MLADLNIVKKYGFVLHSSISCAQIFYMYTHVGVPDAQNPTMKPYPSCGLITSQNGQLTSATINPKINTGTYVSVGSDGKGPENAAAMIYQIFPMAGWVAIALHVFAVDLYLWLTPAEHYRLRTVSYQRQIEAGTRPREQYRDAGITSTRIGDAPDWWSLPEEEYRLHKGLQTRIDTGNRMTRPETLGERSDSEMENRGRGDCSAKTRLLKLPGS